MPFAAGSAPFVLVFGAARADALEEVVDLEVQGAYRWIRRGLGWGCVGPDDLHGAKRTGPVTV